MKFLRKTSKGYIYDKRLFWGAMLVSIILVLYIFSLNNWSIKYNVYTVCNGPGKCENPYLKGYCKGVLCDINCVEEWCNQKYLEPGSYGERPPAIMNYFIYIVLGLVMFALVLNHFIHNRGKRFHIELNLSKKWLDKLSKMGEKGEDEER